MVTITLKTGLNTGRMSATQRRKIRRWLRKFNIKVNTELENNREIFNKMFRDLMIDCLVLDRVTFTGQENKIAGDSPAKAALDSITSLIKSRTYKDFSSMNE